tara:strand:- start:737 stop:5125 length:4389 start_codon:yes stop_codon:yes gene_type:complete
MAGPSESIEVSIEQLLNGRLVHKGNDLTIAFQNLSGASETVLLKNYFDTSPNLVTTNGSILKGNIVNLLAINSQPLDQAYVAFEDPQAIGKITTTDGAVSVQRLDQTIQLNQGDFIYLNDIIKSNTSAVGIAFADETTMSVDPNSTMVIDDFVYDPENPTTGSMNANVLEGNFSFVSGQIAKVGNDAMKVTTPVLTIGVRGTQVAGKANTDGQENEIVLLPNEDGTVGQIMIKNESGEVLLTEAYQATTIFDPYTVPTVPVILQKTEVLKKFASTIATTKKAEKIAKVERETEEAVKQKEEAEEEKEELEEEKEKLEEEAEELTEEKEELEEKVEELEEEKEEVEEAKEEIEEKLEEVFEEKEEIEEKKEAVAEEIEELEEKLEEVPVAEKEKIEQELQKLEEEFEEIEEEVQEIEKEIDVVAKEKVQVEKKVREIEKEFEQAQDDFSEIEQNIQVIEKEVLQVIEKEQIIEQEIKFVEEKFDQIVQEFEVFQEEFVQEFEDFIPEEEIQQFIEEAPIELIEEFQENIIEKLEEEKINVQKNENEVARDEDPFSEENVEKKLDELDEKQEELIEKADELMEKDMQLQEEAKQLEEEAKALEEEALQLEKEAEEAYRNNDQEAIEEIEQKFEELDEEFQQIDDSFQELDEQYEEINEDFEQLNEEFVSIDEEFQEVFQTNENMPVRIPEDGPMYNEDNDVFDVPEDQQVDDMVVENFIQEEKEKALENNVYAQEAEDFFNNEEVVMNEEVSDQVQDLFILNTTQMETFIDGTSVVTADDYYEQEDEWQDYDAMLDYNEQAYEDQLEADDWFDQWIAELAEEQNINVAPWLDMPNDSSHNENTAVNTALGYVYGTDANGDQLTYSILSDPSGKLAIDGSKIYLASPFSVTQDTTYSILLKVTDPYGASDVDEWQITVENNHSPTISTTSAVSKAENVSTGEDIATMSASDAESETITWSITAGNDSNLFTINSSTGLIETAGALDYETATSHTLTVTATDAWGNTSTANQVVNITDVAETTTYTKSVNYGGIATWGAKFSEDTVQDNSWTQKTALIVSNSNTYNQQDNAKANLEAEGFTVTEKTIDNIISGGYNELKGYSTVFELNWSDENSHSVHFSGTQVGSYSSAVKNAFEDYLQSGGSLYKSGEYDGTGYNTQNQNAKDLLAQIGGNMTWSGNAASGTTSRINADYLVGPDTNGTTNYSPYSSAKMSTTDGSLMQNNGASAEWGPDVLNTNIQGTMMVLTDFNHLGYQYNTAEAPRFKTYANWLLEENEDNSAIATYDTEYIPLFTSTQSPEAHTAENDITEVEAFHLGNNVYIGGGMSHIDWVWDDSADTAYWAFNADMDSGTTPTQADDHYGVIGYDADGDGDLWETTDTFTLDKIKILDDSVDYMKQDSDAAGNYYLKVTPVTYSGGSWTVETTNTMTVTNTTGLNDYLNLNSNFTDINYALIETESALISEVVVTA